VLKAAPKGSFMVGEVSVLEYARMLSDMMGKMAAGMGAPAMKLDLGEGPDKNPVAFWMKADGGGVALRYNVPVAPIKKVVAAFQKAQREMMEKMREMQPPPGPVPPVPLPGDAPGAERF